MNKFQNPKRRGGFTLIEILISSAMASLLLVVIYTLGNSVNILAAKSFAINSTGTQARNTMDLIQARLQEAYTVPVPIDSSGTALSGTSLTGTAATATGFVPVVSGTAATLTGTGAGITFYRVVGGPYVVTVPSGGISSTANSITFTCDKAANPTPPAPLPTDTLMIYTTAVTSGTSYQVWADLSGTATSTSSGTKVTYTQNISSIRNGVSGAATGISRQTDNNNNVITPSALLLRPTAFVIVSASTNTPQLRYIDGYTVSGTNAYGDNIDVNSYTKVLTRDIEPTSVEIANNDTISSFGIVTMGYNSFVGVILHVRSGQYDAILNYKSKQRTDFCTFMGIGSMVSLKSNPN